MPAACAEQSRDAATPRLVPFAPAHLLTLEMGESDRAILGGFDRARCAANWPSGPAWSLVQGGRVLGCGGFLEQGDAAVAWTVLSDRLRARPFVLHRTVRRILTETGVRYRRIRATADAAFLPAHRWLRALGFRPAGLLPGYGPGGATFVEYER